MMAATLGASLKVSSVCIGERNEKEYRMAVSVAWPNRLFNYVISNYLAQSSSYGSTGESAQAHQALQRHRETQ